MLVLSRKENERIMIGDSITIMVVEINRDKARLGVQAPPDVPVHREEVYKQIHRGSQQRMSEHRLLAWVLYNMAENGQLDTPDAFERLLEEYAKTPRQTLIKALRENYEEFERELGGE